MKIDRVEVFVTELPERIRRRLSTGTRDSGGPGEILGKPLLVKIHANGAVGYGAVRPITPGHFLPDTVHSVFVAVRDFIGPMLIGRSVADIEMIWRACDLVLPENVNARAAVDVALHDLLGKLLGVPVHVLLGGRAQDRIPLEGSVSLSSDGHEAVDECRRLYEMYGLRNFSLKAGGPGGWKGDVANVATLRKAFGDDVTLGLDPNMAWTTGDAIRALHAMREYDVAYIEQPVERSDLAGLARVRANAGGVSIIADESIHGLHDVLKIIEMDAADALCVKLYKLGGYRAAMKLTVLAEAANLQVDVGGRRSCRASRRHQSRTTTPLSPHRSCCRGEFLYGVGGVKIDPLVPETDFVIDNGYVMVPTGPVSELLSMRARFAPTRSCTPRLNSNRYSAATSPWPGE